MARRWNIWLLNSSIKPILGCRPGGNSLILSPRTWVPISWSPGTQDNAHLPPPLLTAVLTNEVSVPPGSPQPADSTSPEGG